MDGNKVSHRRAVTTRVLKDSEFLLIEVLAPSRDAQIRNRFAWHRMQKSLLTYFRAIYLMILRLFSHRIYRKKGIVSIGNTGGLPTAREKTQSQSMGDDHRMASASRSVIECPKPKAHPREEDRCPHLICTTLLPKSRRCLPSIVSGTRLWRISTRASSRAPRRATTPMCKSSAPMARSPGTGWDASVTRK